MPMGDGKLLLPVKAEIRKQIKRQDGDFVHIIYILTMSHLKCQQKCSSV